VTGFTMTHHATCRGQQRAARRGQVEQLFLLSDISSSVDRHLSAIRLSRAALQEAVADGLPPGQAERLQGRSMILSDDGAVVSLVHLHGRRSANYKRRDRRPYWKGAKA
jgi:hypothetical protein